MKIIFGLAMFAIIIASAFYSMFPSATPKTVSSPATSPATSPVQESAVISSFSLEAIIRNLRDPGIKLPRNISSNSGGGAGTTDKGEVTSYRRESVLNCEIDAKEGRAFDETNLMKILQDETEKHMNRNGAQIIRVGNFGLDFYYDYRVGEIYGSIEVVGAKKEANIYKLLYVVREISWNERNKLQSN